jgi:hypothetical protein
MNKLSLLTIMLPLLLCACGSSDADAPPVENGGAGAAGEGGSGAAGQAGAAGALAGGNGGSSSGSAGASAGSGGTTAGSGGETAGGAGASSGEGGASGSGGGGAGAGGGLEPPAGLPDALKVPDSSSVVTLKARGVGVQVYTCTSVSAGAAGAAGAAGGAGAAGAAGARGGAGGGGESQFQWVFKEPKADLVDDSMTKIGIHYAGPTWEANDGSKVVGSVLAKAASPTPGNVPWLLLEVKSTSGTGVLSGVAFIQRVETTGGVAPADGCDEPHVGTLAEIDYQADYYFYAPAP